MWGWGGAGSAPAALAGCLCWEPGGQWHFSAAVCCCSVAWSDTGDSGVAAILISLGSFQSRAWHWEKHKPAGVGMVWLLQPQEGRRKQSTRSCFSFSLAFDILRGLSSVTPQRRRCWLCCDIWGFLLWQFVPFLPFLVALHSLQLVPAPCSAVQQGGMRCLRFLSCLFVFSSLGRSPGTPFN